MPLLRPTRTAVLLGLLVLLAAQAFMGTSSSATGAVSDAEREDMTTLAAHLGINLEEAIRGYSWRDDLSEVIAMIEELYPDDLSSSAKTSPTGAWISFAGEVPAGVRPMLKQFNDTYPHVSVELRADAGYSRKEKAEAIKAVHYTVLGHEKGLDAGSGLKKGPTFSR